MLNKDPFRYFSDEVIAKLSVKWNYAPDVFESICRKGRWALYRTGLSYNPPVMYLDTSSFFGDLIDPYQEYIYEWYELECQVKTIFCIVYYKELKVPVRGIPDREVVAVCFYA